MGSMPIITDGSDPQLFKRLEVAGAAVLSWQDAESQDIRPARIGLLNLMPAPAMEETELHWLRNISHTILQIEPVLLRFDEDRRMRTDSSRSKILQRYTPLSDARDQGIDALIITGDNLELKPEARSPELLPFGDVLYEEKLKECIDWARGNVRSVIYSCWASHFALNHLYGLRRDDANNKTFGVYRHEVNFETQNSILEDMDDVVTAPHSRWGNIPPEQVTSDTDLQLLAVNEQIGWLLLASNSSQKCRELFIQGHPEYGRETLRNEYLRDGRSVAPENYNAQNPRLNWANDARALHTNWIRGLYEDFSEQPPQQG